MTYSFKPNRKAVDEQIDRAAEYEASGETAVSGMTYEQGVLMALRWAIGDEESAPIEEDMDGNL